jgi:hypothetical protein
VARTVRENGGVTDTGRTPRLTSDDVALVLHRAAEIEAADTGAGDADGFDPAAIEEAAREAGLSPTAVRQAVAELRAGVLAPAPDTSAGRSGRRGRGRAAWRAAARSTDVTRPGGGTPAAAGAAAGAGSLPARTSGSRTVAHQRLVAAPPAAVQATIDRFLRTQMFELRRRSGDRSLYRPRDDMVAGLRRRLDFAGAIKLDRLHLVDVVATPVDDQTLVRVEAELTSSHANVIAGGAAAGTGVAVTMGLLGALLPEVGLVIAALPAGAMIGVGSIRVGGARWRRHRDDVAEVLASLLDRL